MKDLSARQYRLVVIVYCSISLILTAYYVIRKDFYHLFISALSILMPLIIEAYNRILPMERTRLLDVMVLGFIFLSYPLGSCVDFNAMFPWYDKFCHMLSGVFVSILAMAVYYMVKPGHCVERKDEKLAVLFVFFGSMGVAGLWEISEYCLAPLVGRDLQHVAASGVGDSMQDMIVCLIGTLCALPSLSRLCRGRRSWLAAPVEVFLQNNGGTRQAEEKTASEE